MICYYADLGSKCLRLVKENFPCGTTNQEQYGIFSLVLQTSFQGKTILLMVKRA